MVARSINFFIHNYLFSSLTLSVLYYTALNSPKLTNSPWRLRPSAKCLIMFFSQQTSRSCEREAKKQLSDIADIKFHRSHCSRVATSVDKKRPKGLITISLSWSDDLQCGVNILRSKLVWRHFQLWEGGEMLKAVWAEILSYFMRRYEIHVFLMAWSLTEGSGGLTFLPSVDCVMLVTSAFSPGSRTRVQEWGRLKSQPSHATFEPSKLSGKSCSQGSFFI